MAASRRSKSKIEAPSASSSAECTSPRKKAPSRRGNTSGGKCSGAQTIIRAKTKKKPTTTTTDHATAIKDAITGDLQLKISKCKHTRQKLEEKLRCINKEKESELKAIRDEVRKMKEETKRLAKEQHEAGLLEKEASNLRQENKALMEKQAKLKANNRNLRINNMRLEKACCGNSDYFLKLRMHHDRLEKDSKGLEKFEAEYKERVNEAQEIHARVTDQALAEHRKKLLYRHAVRKAIQMAEELGDAAIVLKLYEYYERVQKYEEMPDIPFPFGSSDDEENASSVVVVVVDDGSEEEASSMLDDKFRESELSRRSSVGPGVKPRMSGATTEDSSSSSSSSIILDDKDVEENYRPCRRSSIGATLTTGGEWSSKRLPSSKNPRRKTTSSNSKSSRGKVHVAPSKSSGSKSPSRRPSKRAAAEDCVSER